jgi:uncharacterized oligopeptide transporter (OPT) family protein
MSEPKRRFLPPVGSVRYHLLLSLVAIFVLGPLGGIAASYMNFSLGFFIGGQVLAGILGSAVTYGYGPQGKHGANYMQTMAASVAGLAAMGVLIQAMVWLGMTLPPAWQLVVFFLCVGMFGVGVGMLYTPILVDRLKLTYPSGLAVANILRALTDPVLLRRSIAKLGGGMGLGVAGAWAVEKLVFLQALGVSASTVGAGMIVASRIAVPGLVLAVIGHFSLPALRGAGWLGETEPFRKIGFLIALAMILGAAVVDLTLIGWRTVRRVREVSGQASSTGVPQREPARDDEADASQARGLSLRTLGLWVGFWAIAVVLVGHFVLGRSAAFLAFAIVLAFLFVMINGISVGVSDSNPISSAFVVAVLLMSGLGLKDPITGLIAASILLVACSVGVDMQQDRSTGARLGTNRVIQFRYQVIGVVMGAVLAVLLAKTFMQTYPVLKINSFDNPKADVGQWQSAMTYKFVGALRDLGNLPLFKLKAIALGFGFGLVTEIARKLLFASPAYRRYIERDKLGFAVGWTVDAILLSSPYALSFGGFVELPVAAWFAVGGCLTSIVNGISAARPRAKEDANVPEDMSTTSLMGGGLVAGESLFALGIGVIGLLSTMFRK